MAVHVCGSPAVTLLDPLHVALLLAPAACPDLLHLRRPSSRAQRLQGRTVLPLLAHTRWSEPSCADSRLLLQHAPAGASPGRWLPATASVSFAASQPQPGRAALQAAQKAVISAAVF